MDRTIEDLTNNPQEALELIKEKYPNPAGDIMGHLIGNVHVYSSAGNNQVRLYSIKWENDDFVISNFTMIPREVIYGSY